MKKWFVILMLSLLLTGCGKKQEAGEGVTQTEESKETISESTEATTETADSTEEVTESVESTEISESTEVTESTETTVSTECEETVEEEIVVEETLLQDELQKAEFYFPNSSEEEISEEILAGMSAGNLWVARNEIYARHGRIFEDPVLNSYFQGCSWYVPSIQPEDFDDTILNSVECSNIRKIQIVEAQALGEIPIADRLTVLADDNLDKAFFAYIKDGDMFYFRNARYGFTSNASMEEFNDLCNIRRIKTYRRTPEEAPCPCLITESGEVYWLNITYTEAEEIKVERFEALADYQVEDILYYVGGENSCIRVLLKDGSVISLEGKGGNSGYQAGGTGAETKAEEVQEKILTSDLFVLKCEIDDLFYAYIEDGCFYYYKTDESFIYTESDKVRKMVKYEGLDNIKRMKLYNIGSGVDLYPCLITEEGEVYWVNNIYMFDRQEVYIEQFEFLKDYQVEDILYFDAEWQYRVEVLLKDGSTVYLESETWG